MGATQIFLNASELSTVIAFNPYENTTNMLIKYWQKYFPNDYDENVKKLAINGVIIKKETEKEFVEKHIGDNKTLQQQMKDTMTTNCYKDLQEKQRLILEQFKHVEGDEREKLTRALTSLSNKSFGVRKEVDGIGMFEEIHNKKVIRVGKYFRQKILTMADDDIEWWIGGKIDGITEENELVEVKNRVREFFNNLRNYEKVQIYLYFKLLDITKGYLVETLVTNNNKSINVINVEWDYNFWQDMYMRIVNFANLFMILLNSNTAKQNLLLLVTNIEQEKILESQVKDYIITGDLGKLNILDLEY